MLEVNKSCSFGSCYACTKQDARGNATFDASRGFKQPDTIYVKQVVPSGDRECTASIVLDQVVHGCEWAAIFTIPKFLARIKDTWSIVGSELFNYYTKCLQGAALVTWEDLLASEFPGNPSRTNAGSTRAIMLYIEKIAQCTNLSDKIIRKISNWTKSEIMPAADFKNRIKDLYRYCARPYFCGNLAIPDDQAQREQFFLATPKDHLSTCGQTSLQVTDTWEELLNKLCAYHKSDVISGRYGTIENIYNDSLAAMTKRPSYFGHPPVGRSIHVSIQGQGKSSYNNYRNSYNCSDSSYNDSSPDNRKRYQLNDRSSRTTGKNSSCSNHQSRERRYERNGNTNDNSNGNSNRSRNYRSYG